MLSVKQGGNKYHFLSLWYDSTWDWTPVSKAFGERSKMQALFVVVCYSPCVFPDQCSNLAIITHETFGSNGKGKIMRQIDSTRLN